MVRTQAIVWLSLLLGAAPAMAAGADPVADPGTKTRVEASPTAQRVPTFSQPAPLKFKSDSRPVVLPALYVGSALLQGYDAYSTLSALRQGGIEANPLARGMTANPAAFIAVKSSVAFLSIYAAERLWRDHHRFGAVALMAISNGAMAAVALHNASALRSLR